MTLKRIYEIIFRDRRNVFITGMGGCGKSHLLKLIKNKSDSLTINCYVTSTTGVSAFNINGTTIHRFSGIKLADKPFEVIINNILKNPDCLERWRKCEILIIDEVSMLGEYVFSLLNDIAQYVKNNLFPFGGIQLILSGDFLQLPPINDNFIFNSESWAKLKFKIIKLRHPYRYTDLNYFDILKRIRLSEHTQEDIKALNKRTQSYKIYQEFDKDPKLFLYNTLNNLSQPNRNPVHFSKELVNIVFSYIGNDHIKPTRLFSHKIDVERYNNDQLEKINEQPHYYNSTDSCTTKRKNKKVNINDLSIFMDNIVPNFITLKKSAQVMLTYNLNIEQGLVNGNRGIVINCCDDYVDVLFTNGMVTKIYKHTFNYETDDYVFNREQLPLILCFATSIHKSQGISLDYCVMDLGQSLFLPGLAYVALSRVRSLDGVLIEKFSPEKIKCNQEALEYVKKIE